MRTLVGLVVGSVLLAGVVGMVSHVRAGDAGTKLSMAEMQAISGRACGCTGHYPGWRMWAFAECGHFSNMPVPGTDPVQLQCFNDLCYQTLGGSSRCEGEGVEEDCYTQETEDPREIMWTYEYEGELDCPGTGSSASVIHDNWGVTYDCSDSTCFKGLAGVVYCKRESACPAGTLKSTEYRDVEYDSCT